jgi:hypothetical protein
MNVKKCSSYVTLHVYLWHDLYNIVFKIQQITEDYTDSALRCHVSVPASTQLSLLDISVCVSKEAAQSHTHTHTHTHTYYTYILYCLIKRVVLILILILATQTQDQPLAPKIKTSECALALCIALWAQKMRFWVTFVSKYKCGQHQIERQDAFKYTYNANLISIIDAKEIVNQIPTFVWTAGISVLLLICEGKEIPVRAKTGPEGSKTSR